MAPTAVERSVLFFYPPSVISILLLWDCDQQDWVVPGTEEQGSRSFRCKVYLGSEFRQKVPSQEGNGTPGELVVVQSTASR